MRLVTYAHNGNALTAIQTSDWPFCWILKHGGPDPAGGYTEARYLGLATANTTSSSRRLREERFMSELLGSGRKRRGVVPGDEVGRRREIDVVNGAVVAMAEEQGVSAPINKALLALVLGNERAPGLRYGP